MTPEKLAEAQKECLNAMANAEEEYLDDIAAAKRMRPEQREYIEKKALAKKVCAMTVANAKKLFVETVASAKNAAEEDLALARKEAEDAIACGMLPSIAYKAFDESASRAYKRFGDIQVDAVKLLDKTVEDAGNVYYETMKA